MSFVKTPYLVWTLKRYLWPLVSLGGIAAASTIGSMPLLGGFSAALFYFAGIEIGNRLAFNAYPLKDPAIKEVDAWINQLHRFKAKKTPLAFRGANRADIAQEISHYINRQKTIIQSRNNLCGPISFIQFLIRHNPNLVVQLMCEYYENGCTFAPLYLQSSIWDRWFLFKPLSFFTFNLISKNESQNKYIEGLANALKNTHNFLGYNRDCFVEVFRGSTEPFRIIHWLEQAGYSAGQHLVLMNVNHTQPMPGVVNMMMGGLNGDVTKKTLPSYRSENRHENEFIRFKQSPCVTPLHHLFNIGASHWELIPSSSEIIPSEYIRIKLK